MIIQQTLTLGKRIELLLNCNKCSQKKVLPRVTKFVTKQQLNSCQDHILDRNFCLVKDEELGGNTMSSKFFFEFILMHKTMKTLENVCRFISYNY